MQKYKTSNCIVCGKEANVWHGHVIGKQKMALGNLVDVKVIAGFCDEHDNSIESDENGCYGEYSNTKHGKLKPLF